MINDSLLFKFHAVIILINGDHLHDDNDGDDHVHDHDDSQVYHTSEVFSIY